MYVYNVHIKKESKINKCNKYEFDKNTLIKLGIDILTMYQMAQCTDSLITFNRNRNQYDCFSFYCNSTTSK